MSCTLTSGRTNPCKDEIGGIKAVLIFPYVKYTRDKISSGFNNSLLTAFPNTTYYRYEVQGGDFTESINNNEDGFLVEQTTTFTLWKRDVLTNVELEKIEKQDLRYIVEFNNGKYRLCGLWNGAKVDSIVSQTGGALAELNGYNITLKSNESVAAPFIDSLVSVGFIEFEEAINYLFMDGDGVLFMDGNEMLLN